jgi:sulfate/thiosulfate transport system permease protein
MDQLMSGHTGLALAAMPAAHLREATADPPWIRALITALALLLLGIFLLIPLAAVFTEALRDGIRVYAAAITSSEARSAIALTLLTAGVAVPLNLIFGVMAGWAITRFQFRGRSLLITLIDLPFAVSPVISLVIRRSGVGGGLACRSSPQDSLRCPGNRAGYDVRHISVHRA